MIWLKTVFFRFILVHNELKKSYRRKRWQALETLKAISCICYALNFEQYWLWCIWWLDAIDFFYFLMPNYLRWIIDKILKQVQHTIHCIMIRHVDNNRFWHTYFGESFELKLHPKRIRTIPKNVLYFVRWKSIKNPILMNWNESYWVGLIYNRFTSNEIQNVFSDCFRIIWEHILKWLGITLIQFQSGYK